MRKILAVARNTFREAVRNRIFASLIFFTLALLGFALAMSSASLNEEVRLMTDVGLFLTSTAAVFIAIFTGVNLVYKELERKTIYTLMAKPISRPQFLLGKYLRLAADHVCTRQHHGSYALPDTRCGGWSSRRADHSSHMASVCRSRRGCRGRYGLFPVSQHHFYRD